MTVVSVNPNSPIFGFMYIFLFIAIILILICRVIVFRKLGYGIMEAIFPIYTNYKFYEIAMENGFLFLFTFIPFIGWLFDVYGHCKFAEACDKDLLYGLGLYFLGFIFWPLLAFGEDFY